MSYTLVHKQTDKFFNLQVHSLEVFNLGINPKVYKTYEDAEEDLLKLDMYKKRELEICSNSQYGLRDHGQPRWYKDRDSMKLTNKQEAKLKWYENTLVLLEKRIEFCENLKSEDIKVLEI